MDITGKTTDQIRDAIQMSIDKAADAGGGTVTVAGIKIDADLSLKLDVNDNVTVIWNAEYRGTVGSGSLIDLSTGGGTFNVAEGSIEVTCKDVWGSAISSGNVHIVISGGAVAANGNTTISAIESENGRVTIKGGSINAVNTGRGVAYAIKTRNGNILIDGGVIKAEGEGSYGVYTVRGNITKNDGIVEVTGKGSTAMYSMRGNIRNNTVTRKFIMIAAAAVSAALLGVLIYIAFF
jgi:hypothetical protein